MALQPSVHDDAGNLAALARASSVSEEEASPITKTLVRRFQPRAFVDGPVSSGQIAGEGIHRIDEHFALRIGKKLVLPPVCWNHRLMLRDRRGNRPHRDRFHQRGRMNGSIVDCYPAWPVG